MATSLLAQEMIGAVHPPYVYSIHDLPLPVRTADMKLGLELQA